MKGRGFFCLDLGHWVKGKGSVGEITWTDRKRRERSKVTRSRGIDLVFWKLSLEKAYTFSLKK